ncbi:Hypothetical_protein [Hexamita inflata]|uniref:Hypothetical_protein n=1 Tax=Hexamita inflata TaxID=28002 RepID=A0AA86N7Q9_9EUKA|nr:Hypothetical protein HINF_LOCUS2077 [Hexamita inflata]
MKYFGKTNYHRCRCSVAASWILVLSIFQNINISMLNPNSSILSWFCLLLVFGFLLCLCFLCVFGVCLLWFGFFFFLLVFCWSSVDVDIEVKYIQKLFLDHSCLQPSSILFKSSNDEIFLEDKLPQISLFYCSQLDSGLSIFQNINISMLKPNQVYCPASSVSVDVEVKYIQKLFLDYRCLQPSSILFKSSADEIFLEDKLPQISLFCCSQLDSGLSIFQNINISILKPNQVYCPVVFCLC